MWVALSDGETYVLRVPGGMVIQNNGNCFVPATKELVEQFIEEHSEAEDEDSADASDEETE